MHIIKDPDRDPTPSTCDVIVTDETISLFAGLLANPDGGRLTAVCPDCTAGACWFCARHKGCLNCDICGGESGLSGDWVDGTRLVDDSQVGFSRHVYLPDLRDRWGEDSGTPKIGSTT